MKAATHLNYLALNQNILGKALRIGSGPEDGTETEPHQGRLDSLTQRL